MYKSCYIECIKRLTDVIIDYCRLRVEHQRFTETAVRVYRHLLSDGFNVNLFCTINYN